MNFHAFPNNVRSMFNEQDGLWFYTVDTLPYNGDAALFKFRLESFQSEQYRLPTSIWKREDFEAAYEEQIDYARFVIGKPVAVLKPIFLATSNYYDRQFFLDVDDEAPESSIKLEIFCSPFKNRLFPAETPELHKCADGDVNIDLNHLYWLKRPQQVFLYRINNIQNPYKNFSFEVFDADDYESLGSFTIRDIPF